MIIGVPTEIKNHEYRVGLVPASVLELVTRGHQVHIQSGAGQGIGIDDQSYVAAGATIVNDAADIFAHSDLIVKVKEPLAIERKMLRENQTLFTFLHLAPDLAQTDDLIESGAKCIAYETVTAANGSLPLLAPMSEVAGRLAIQAGAYCLEKKNGGSGVLLGGVSGVTPARVVIIGGGVVGRNAAQMAAGMNADVTLLDNNIDTLRHIDSLFNGRVKTEFSNRYTLGERIKNADLVIGGVLIPGAAAPKLVTREMINCMPNGSAVVDVAIDQGGCFETSVPTSHDQPTYLVNGIVHYCVTNMPGAVARTSTFALNNATLPFVLQLADKGCEQALLNNPYLLSGLNIYAGKLTNLRVAESQSRRYFSAQDLLN